MMKTEITNEVKTHIQESKKEKVQFIHVQLPTCEHIFLDYKQIPLMRQKACSKKETERLNICTQ